MKKTLSAQQQRQHTLQRRQQVEQQHLYCEMDFRKRGPHWGMYCSAHNKWIRWIPQRELETLGMIEEQTVRLAAKEQAHMISMATQEAPVRDSW
jgi:hypothetical protein